MNTIEIWKRVALLVCAALLGSNLLMAQAGSLDPTFGTGGIVTTPNSNTGCSPCFLAIQSDGKILVGGGATIDDVQVAAVARYTTNGVLDSTFGTGGIVTLSQEGGSGAFGMALQPDGKIVVGTTLSSSFGLAVVRLTTNGNLDTTFGTNGVASVQPFNDLFFSPITGGIAIESNGDILVSAQAGIPFVGVVTRLLGNGSVDTTFGSGGAAVLVSGAPNLLLLPGGKFLVSSSFGPSAAAVYTSNGSLDTTFGLSGQVSSLGGTAFIPVTGAKLVAVGSLVTATVPPPGSNTVGFAVVRYAASGSIDGTFGTRGGTTTNFPNEGYSVAMAAAAQSDGDIVAVGVTEAESPAFGQEPSDFALARYTPNGQLDTTFGTDGLVTTAIGVSGSSASASAVAIQSDGKIVVAGEDVPTAGNPSLGFVLARYLAQ